MQIDEIELILNQMSVKRLRFENIVNELLVNGLLTKEELVISPERSPLFNFERDVTGIAERAENHTQRLWQFEIPRDGFYDTLPERLFHRAKKRTKDEDQWAEIREEEDKQETESRHFFLPFDNAFNHQKAAISRFETGVFSGEDDLLLSELVKIMAPEAEKIGLKTIEKLKLIFLVVHAHRTAGDWEQTALCFTNFLGVPVEITYRYQRMVQSGIDPAHNWSAVPLSDCGLGLDWVLTDPKQTHEVGLVKLNIGPLSDEQLADYLPNGRGLQRVQLLADYLLPIEVDWQLSVEPEPESGTFSLSDSNNAGRLGVSTSLRF